MTQTLPNIAGRYALLNEIGSGGMGTVYRALDRLTGNTVALKRVSVAPSDSASTAEQFDLRLALAGEFRLLASLRHPHIISVIDYGFDADAIPYYTMDLLENPQSILKASQAQPLSTRMNWIVQMLQALAYLHRRGILHRDLKPANVLVSPQGNAYLLDFGLALSREQWQELMVAGTLAYMSPEALQGSPLNEMSDLYAVGVIAYELITGRLPFHSENISDLINRILASKPDFDLFASSLKELADTQRQTTPSIVSGDATVILSTERGQPVPISAPLPELDITGSDLLAVVQRLLTKNPFQRYDNAVEVIQALGAALHMPVQVETQATRESFIQGAHFVGRESELAVLETEIEKTLTRMDERKGVWLVGGESGIGKSRLLDELRTRALVRGMLVVRGQAISEGGQAYQLWREGLARLVLSVLPDDTQAGVLKTIVPDIAQLLGRDIPDAAPLDPRASQRRLLVTIVDLMKKVSQPLLILLEDLQWADSESLALINAAAALVKTQPMILIASYRSDEMPTVPAQIPMAETLSLPRLSETAIRELSEAILGISGGQAHIVNRLIEETEGNVFFVVEIMRALAEEMGTLDRVALATLPAQVFAGGIEQVVRRRLDRVPETDRAALQYAALLGRQIDPRLIAYFTEDVDGWLRRCADVAVLEVQEGIWRFTHDKLRESILRAFSPDETRDYNRRVAETIEQVYPDDPAYEVSLADHWYAAGNLAKEAVYAERAGRRLTAISAYPEAIRLMERALARLAVDDPIVIAISLIIANTYRYLGKFESATTAYNRAIAYGTPMQRARALNGLAAAVLMQGNINGAYEHLVESLAIHDTIDDPIGKAGSLNNMSATMLYRGELPMALSYGEQSLAIFQANNDRAGTAGAYMNIGAVVLELNEKDKAQEYWEQTLAIRRELGDRWGASSILVNLGVISEENGDLDMAAQRYNEAIAIARDIGDLELLAMPLGNLGNIAMTQKNYLNAEAYFEQSISILRQRNSLLRVPEVQVLLGDCYIEQGKYTEADIEFNAVLELSWGRGQMPESLGAIYGLAKTLHRTGNSLAAIRLYRVVAAHASAGLEVRNSAQDALKALYASDVTDEGLTLESLAAELLA